MICHRRTFTGGILTFQTRTAKCFRWVIKKEKHDSKFILKFPYSPNKKKLETLVTWFVWDGTTLAFEVRVEPFWGPLCFMKRHKPFHAGLCSPNVNIPTSKAAFWPIKLILMDFAFPLFAKLALIDFCLEMELKQLL